MLLSVPRKPRLALLALVVFLAVPAATARAVAHMPVGFYDDPSFRWAADPATNLQAAQRAHASIVHVLADWASIAPTRPKHPLSGFDPAYHLSDLDTLVRSAQRFDMQVLLTIAETPTWANGDQTPNYPPKRLSDLTNFAHMLASRYNGAHAGYGNVAYFSVWNEPNLQEFLTPQYEGNTIVSPQIYAKLYLAAYKGIKAGNPHALVAAGETSNRGHTHPTPGSDDVAPATFAHLLSVAAPKLPFDAWATHPYPTVYRLGPTQRVSYPNVGFSTINRFGASLQEWFHRRVPIWVTEYAEQTKPQYAGGVSYAQEATDAKKVLQLAATSPYVEMFIWFIFRDAAPPAPGEKASSWFSGVENANGTKKPAYGAFSATAKGIVGALPATVPAKKKISVRVGVPTMTYFNPIGTKVGVTYKLYLGKKIVAIGQPLLPITIGGAITVPVGYPAEPGKTYTLTVMVNDKHGDTEARVITVTTAS
jgi:hypothetical protein